MAQKSWLKIGIVGKAHGLKGAFFVSGRDDAVPSELGMVVIGESAEVGLKAKILHNRMQGERPVLQCDSIDSREMVDELKGLPVWAKRAELDVGPNEYCWSDLVGKAVIDRNGRAMGRIIRVENYGASDFVTVANQRGLKLAIPLVTTYFDMGFTAADDEVRLVVEADVFTEAWE